MTPLEALDSVEHDLKLVSPYMPTRTQEILSTLCQGYRAALAEIEALKDQYTAKAASQGRSVAELLVAKNVALEAELKECQKQRADALTEFEASAERINAARVAARAEADRLAWLLLECEWTSAGNCHFCGAELAIYRHSTSCRAFTPDGEVKRAP